MNIEPMSIINAELIGLHTHVVASSDPGQVCNEGKIIDETREMFYIKQDSRVIKVPKSIAVFDFTLPDGTIVRVNGKILRGRPEERLKKSLRRRW